MDYLQHLRPDWKPDENRWKCTSGKYGIEICTKYEEILHKDKKRAQTPYNKDVGRVTPSDSATKLAAHHIIPHNVLIAFFKNVLASKIPKQQKFFFILYLNNLAEKMKEFLKNEDVFNNYFKKNNIKRETLDFKMQSFEWFPGNLMMGMFVCQWEYHITFLYMPCNLLLGPEPQTRCKDGVGCDPGDGFEEFAHHVIGKKYFDKLKTIYTYMLEFNGAVSKKTFSEQKLTKINSILSDIVGTISKPFYVFRPGQWILDKTPATPTKPEKPCWRIDIAKTVEDDDLIDSDKLD